MKMVSAVPLTEQGKEEEYKFENYTNSAVKMKSC